jgi:MoaA/NifB/PqqE/SkfB family radical SAM enzyme
MRDKLVSLGSRMFMPSPKKVVISITNECSMRCKMCYNWTLKDSERSIGKDRWLAVVKELAALKKGELLLNIIGGEPLEKPWAVEIVSEASQHGIKASLTTNASMIDEDYAKRIVSSGLGTLCISLDSLKEEVHDYYRGREGVLHKAMDALDILERTQAAMKTEIILQTIIMDKNKEELADIARWANSRKQISGVMFMSVMKPHFTNMPDDWYRQDTAGLWPKDPAAASNAIDEIIRLKKKGYKIVNSVSHLEIFKRYYQDPSRFIKNRNCDISDFGLYIDSEGTASVCPEEPLGNIKSKTLEEIWYSYANLKGKERMKRCRKNCEFLVNCFFQEEP